MLTNFVRRLWSGRQQAAQGEGQHPARLTQQAIATLDAGDAEAAIVLLEQALRRGGASVEVFTALGTAYRALDEPQRAVEHFRSALDAPGVAPRVVRLRNCAIALREVGEAESARPLLEEASLLAPHDAEIEVDLAGLAVDKADFSDARARIKRALQLDPGHVRAHLALAEDRLAEGDYAQGWLEYEWRFKAAHFAARAPEAGKRWAREAREGTVFVTWEQGLGDQIMYASCFGDLIAAAERCVLECDERLVGLFRRSFPEAAVQPAVATPAATGCEHEIAMGSLPGIFRNDKAQFPQPPAHYLHADAARVAFWRDRLRALGPGPAIGLSWRGGLPASRRALRSIEPETFGGLLRAKDARWISLQYGDVEPDLARIAAASGRQIHHWPEAIADYDETAALVAALDLVVSVCTSIVHLAGALGARAWVLVPAVPEWRYGRRGEQMIWYENVRLFRQPAVRDWESTIGRVQSALAAHSFCVQRTG